MHGEGWRVTAAVDEAQHVVMCNFLQKRMQREHIMQRSSSGGSGAEVHLFRLFDFVLTEMLL